MNPNTPSIPANPTVPVTDQALIPRIARALGSYRYRGYSSETGLLRCLSTNSQDVQELEGYDVVLQALKKAQDSRDIDGDSDTEDLARDLGLLRKDEVVIR